TTTGPPPDRHQTTADHRRTTVDRRKIWVPPPWAASPVPEVRR
ncbi:hypothetical protein A2U01_0094365, partial [Trifolium medium]|nr:hypothetical protein [Trifolium medium]